MYVSIVSGKKAKKAHRVSDGEDTDRANRGEGEEGRARYPHRRRNCQPLEWWKNERLQYKYDPSLGIAVASGVFRVNEAEKEEKKAEVRAKRRREDRKRKGTAHRGRVMDSSEEEDLDEEEGHQRKRKAVVPFDASHLVSIIDMGMGAVGLYGGLEAMINS